MEIIELENHPYYVATQYHPEYLSRPLKPSPPFLGLILASVGKLKSYLARGCRLSPRQLSDDDTGNHIIKTKSLLVSYPLWTLVIILTHSFNNQFFIISREVDN